HRLSRDLCRRTERPVARRRRCGFATAETLRRTFHRRLGVAPSEYRARFRSTAAPAGALPDHHVSKEGEPV
ncbi:GlxA family transcriptional regulator, partial [Streptomyces sp. NPDC006386]